MLKAHKAAARLQAIWDRENPDYPCTIEKKIGKPKSNGAVGWTWFATNTTDDKVYDLGYTEETAKIRIRQWNTRLGIAIRNSQLKSDEAKKSIIRLGQAIMNTPLTSERLEVIVKRLIDSL